VRLYAGTVAALVLGFVLCLFLLACQALSVGLS